MSILDRLAGAPISWGVSEVPGWGVELPRDRVLAEMAELGLVGTELGSAGYLPDTPVELRSLLESYRLELVAGFVPLVLHDPAQRDATLNTALEAAKLLSSAGAKIFVSAAITSWDWSPRQPLTKADWSHLVDMLSAVAEIVAEHEMTQALHPHLGTTVETYDDVRRILDSTDVGWTLDTGHLMIGGTDPVEFIDEAIDRIEHVHLKDVRLDRAEPVFKGESTIMEGVQAGMFCSLGQGDIAIDEIVMALDGAGYDRWYVLEQDVAITGDPPDRGSGPIVDVKASIDYLMTLDNRLARD